MTEDAPDRGAGRRLAELSYDDCIARLGGERLGRIAVVVGHYPQVFPVNYRMDDVIVVFRTHLGTKLLAADHANVGFEVDHVDRATRTGWSVLIQGMAEDVTDRSDDTVTRRSRDAGVDPWVPGAQPRLVRIIPAHVTGRELTAADDDFWSDDRGYL